MSFNSFAKVFAGMDGAVRNQIERMTYNLSMSRERFYRRFFDNRRTDIYAEAGYPDNLSLEVYRDLYEREAIAARVVSIFPKESWKVAPIVFEDDDMSSETEFEKAWSDLDVSLRGQSWNENDNDVGSPIFEALCRVDELSGIGSFGILLLGLSDGKELHEPVSGIDERGRSAVCSRTENVLSSDFRKQYEMGVDAEYQRPFTSTGGSQDNGPLKLLYLKAYDEALVQIVSYESDITNPRYGLPTMYRVLLNDPRLPNEGGAGLDASSRDVHWTRVIHVADNRMSSDVFGIPRMQPVLNRLLDLKKLYAGSAEMYWKGAFPGYSLETHPQLSPADVEVDERQLKDNMENFMAGLQRYFWSTGLSAKSLAPQVVDPSPQIERQIDAICIQLGVPKRKFMGSERGELSSADDEADWQRKIQGRKRTYLIPNILTPFIDRLIAVGVLPCPQAYKIQWNDADILTAKEKMELAEATTRTLALYVTQNVESVMARSDYLSEVLGYADNKVKTFMKNVEKAEQEALDEQEKLMEKFPEVFGGAPSEPGEKGVPFSHGMPRPNERLEESTKPTSVPKTGPKSRRKMGDQPVKGDRRPTTD